MKNLMRQLQLVIGTAAVIVSATVVAIPMPGNTQSINRMVAVVNSTPITQLQLDRLMSTAPQGQQPTTDEALQALINQTLQLQIAKKAGIKVTTSDLKGAISGIAKQNQISVSNMKTKILHSGMSWTSYTAQIKKQLLLTKIQQQAVAGKVSVSNAEVNNFIAKHADQLGTKNKYQYSDLLIPTSDQMTSQKALTIADNTVHTWKPGVQLATLAQKIPANVNASMMIKNKWQTPDNIPNVFLKSLNVLKKGALSQPIVTGNGVHVLQLDQKQITSPAVLKQRAMEILSQQAFMKAVKNWVIGLKKASYIKIFHNTPV